MSAAADPAADWQILDLRTVHDLATRKGAAAVIGALRSERPDGAERARELSALAVAGKLAQMRARTAEFNTWAERHGLRRLGNMLIELGRVLEMPERGQATLQAQALTRLIGHTIDADIKALTEALANADS